MPIGKGGSFTPLTWKNVPTGNPAAFFNGAIQGGDTVFNQQRQMNETEDARLLNEHIAASLAGNPLASDRRVDAIALQESQAFDQKLKSDLLGAGLDQTGQRIDNQYAPGRFQADIDASKAATRASNSDVDVDQATLSEIERVSGIAKKTEADRVKMNELTQGDWNKFRDQHLTDLQALNPNQKLTNAQKLKAVDFADQQVADLVTTRHYRTANEIGDAGFAQSRQGLQSIKASELLAAENSAIRIQQDARKEVDLGMHDKIFKGGQSQFLEYDIDPETGRGIPRFFNKDTDGKIGSVSDQNEIINQAMLDFEGNSRFDYTQLEDNLKQQYGDKAGSMSVGATRLAVKNVLDAPGGRSLNSTQFAKEFVRELGILARDQKSLGNRMNPNGTVTNINNQAIAAAGAPRIGRDPRETAKMTDGLTKMVERLNATDDLPADVGDFVLHADKAQSEQEVNQLQYKVNNILEQLETKKDYRDRTLSETKLNRLKESLSRILKEASEPYDQRSIYQ